MFGSLSYRTRSVELIMRLQRLIVLSLLSPHLCERVLIPTSVVLDKEDCNG
jgi:hypothetical protein